MSNRKACLHTCGCSLAAMKRSMYWSIVAVSRAACIVRRYSIDTAAHRRCRPFVATGYRSPTIALPNFPAASSSAGASCARPSPMHMRGRLRERTIRSEQPQSCITATRPAKGPHQGVRSLRHIHASFPAPDYRPAAPVSAAAPPRCSIATISSRVTAIQMGQVHPMNCSCITSANVCMSA